MKLSERKDHSQMVLKGILSDGATVIKIRQAEEALEIVKMYYKMQQLEVTLEEKNLEMARKRLEEAMVERKTYEKLKEKEFEKFKLQVLEEENKEIDELVSYKFSPVYTKK